MPTRRMNGLTGFAGVGSTGDVANQSPSVAALPLPQKIVVAGVDVPTGAEGIVGGAAPRLRLSTPCGRRRGVAAPSEARVLRPDVPDGQTELNPVAGLIFLR